MKDTDKNVVSFQREVTLAFLRSAPGFAVKAIKGQKNPVKGWDPKKNDKAKSIQLVNELEHTEDNIGIHLRGPLIDVDVDGDALEFLIPALDEFLPDCCHIWGRKSRPKTHRIYQLQEDDGDFDPASHPVLQHLKKIDEVKVEVRGGPQGTRGVFLTSLVYPSKW